MCTNLIPRVWHCVTLLTLKSFIFCQNCTNPTPSHCPSSKEEALAKIRPAFPQWGNSTTTGGNASQITDGAAAIIVMTRREAEKRNLPILAKHITTAVAG